MRSKIIAVILVGLILTSGACGARVPKTALVKVESHEGNELWRPNIAEVSVGGTVTWENTGEVIRSIISDQSLFNQKLSPGQIFRYTFTLAGNFTYHDDPNTDTYTVIVK